MPSARAADPAAALAALRTKILVTGSHGEKAASISEVSLAPAEIAKIQTMNLMGLEFSQQLIARGAIIIIAVAISQPRK